MIIDFSEITKFKKEIAEQYQVPLHFHDGCGGQYFTLDASNAELQKHITDYFSCKGLQVSFSEDGKHFTLSKPSEGTVQK